VKALQFILLILLSSKSTFSFAVISCEEGSGSIEDHALSVDDHCGRPENSQAYEPVVWGKETICFIYEPVCGSVEEIHPQSSAGIALYVASASGEFIRVHGFSKADTEEVIHDAFLSPINSQGELRLFVIHGNRTPSRWISASDLHDVNAFKLSNGKLERDAKISDFFGASGDYYFEGTDDLRHVFPYKTKQSVEGMIGSRIFELLTSSSSAKGQVKEKIFLYADRPFSDSHSVTPAYLVKGDEVIISETSIGWCRITYFGENSSTDAWVKCSGLVVF